MPPVCSSMCSALFRGQWRLKKNDLQGYMSMLKLYLQFLGPFHHHFCPLILLSLEFSRDAHAYERLLLDPSLRNERS